MLSLDDIDYTLYVDMDGVLVDFDAQFLKLGLGHRLKVDNKLLLSSINKEDKYFWSEMDWIDQGKTLWDEVKHYSPTILSRPSGSIGCIEGKIDWIHKHLSKTQPFILETDKFKYANKTSILIDDDKINIIPWVNHGGIGILHTDMFSTIRQLNIIRRHCRK